MHKCMYVIDVHIYEHVYKYVTYIYRVAKTDRMP